MLLRPHGLDTFEAVEGLFTDLGLAIAHTLAERVEHLFNVGLLQLFDSVLMKIDVNVSAALLSQQLVLIDSSIDDRSGKKHEMAVFDDGQHGRVRKVLEDL